jgi:transposase
MTDAEWQAIEPLMPWPAWLDGNGGRPEEYCRRQITDAIRYVVDNGREWRNPPADFPPWRTIHAIFTRWWYDGDLWPSTTTCARRSRPYPEPGRVPGHRPRAAVLPSG